MSSQQRLQANLRRLIGAQALGSDKSPSVSAIARELGIQQSVLSRFLAGETNSINFAAIDKLARHFQVDVARLFEPDISSWEPQARFRAQFGPLLHIAERLTPHKLDAITHLAESLADEKPGSASWGTL